MSGSKNMEQELYRLNLKNDKCVGCKLFSAPIFFALGGYFAMKNRELWKTDPIPQDGVNI